ncbi:MAG TPA: hypothetical protein VLA05_05780 [Coriobacteriia bacterium]|nr:hypothetical protein [Coriobacteriia bacterium]
MLVLAAILILIPFVALIGLAVAGSLSLFGIFHEARDFVAEQKLSSAEAAEPALAGEPLAI